MIDETVAKEAEKILQEFLINNAIGNAVSDHKHGTVDLKAYPAKSPESIAYASKIYELEQRDSALSIEKGEDV